MSSPTGPAEQLAGGSFPKSTNSNYKEKGIEGGGRKIRTQTQTWATNERSGGLSSFHSPLLILFRDIFDIVF
jgi:hypothetical protein